MTPEQSKQFEQINKAHETMSKLTFDYWQTYSHMGTWQFWFLLAMLLLPLAALFILLDRKRALLIGFFGFNVHVWFQYIDTLGVTRGLWNYPYKIVPVLPSSVALDTSFVPVVFMLLYQWTINRKKNFYLFGIGLCFVFSFLVKPALVSFGLIQMYKGVNFFHFFLLYIAIMLVSKWITSLFLHFQIEAGKQPSPSRRSFKLRRWFPAGEKAR
ncbi:CBO0543 family protein [uncultured Paenibacillus sp.]|uniref:CBO0543 family protein n=1 Tax=uncultured Paenibacillus sp. TaxID=227322 RepID=UPI0028D17339|nr:CBO0543 family protein [uncultured Paenibacillus sp.]